MQPQTTITEVRPSITPRPIFQRFTSRKFLLAVAAAVIGVVGNELGWNAETIAAIVAPLGLFIVGESYNDAKGK